MSFSGFETILRVIGAAYIGWIAVITFNSTYYSDNDCVLPLGFKDGFILQFLNPKAIFFVLTVYTAYLQPILGIFPLIFLAALLLGLCAFLVNSTWTVFGSAIRRFLSKPLINRIINGIVSAALLYNAADLIRLPVLISKLFYWPSGAICQLCTIFQTRS